MPSVSFMLFLKSIKGGCNYWYLSLFIVLLVPVGDNFTYGYFLSSGSQVGFFASSLLQNMAYFSSHKSLEEANAACFFPYLE